MQIEELQAQESQLRSSETEGHGAVSALLHQLGSSSPEETQEALQQLLNAAAASKCVTSFILCSLILSDHGSGADINAYTVQGMMKPCKGGIAAGLLINSAACNSSTRALTCLIV